MVRTLATLAVLATLALTSCSADDSDGGSSADRDVDAQQYVADYEQQADEDQASSSIGGAPTTAEPGSPQDIGPLDDTTFVDHGVSGSVETTRDPESTFALDVDTGSYSIARKLLADGVRPPAASVRTEEWVNAFDYGDPAPDDGALGVRAETGLDPYGDESRQRVRVAVSSAEVDGDARPRAHVTLVVDRSGSMDLQERLGLVQASLGVLADRLRDDDTVAVVSFDDQATPILEPTPARDTDRILGAVEELRPGGSTNLEAGLRLGYEQARDSYEDGALNVVVLCSDGVANVGDTLPSSIVDTVSEEGASGIHLVTVGFGMGNYNDHLMEQLADQGDGFYSYVDTFAEAERLFGSELTTTLVPVAAEARAQVTFDPEQVASYRLLGYENRALDDDDDFEDLDVDAGELGTGHRATALYEVQLTDGVEPGAEIGRAELRWADPDDGSAHGDSTVVRAASSEFSPGLGFDLAGAVADTALLFKDESLDPAALADLETRAEALAEEDVAGADELLDVLQAAEAWTY